MMEIVEDLRAAATPPFSPALATVPPGVLSPYGVQAPFGSSAFAARDAVDITSRSQPQAPEAIPGWRARGSLWPQQRYQVRVPRKWNGRLVVAGCPGQRTEFACDLLFGDPLLARGYAYAAGNKGNGDGAVLLEGDATLEVNGVRLPRFALPDGRKLSLWQHAPGHLMERWLDETLELTAAGREIVRACHGTEPELVYAVGLSNGGYQIRRAIEESDLFAGALTWNAVMWSTQNHLADTLALAIEAMQRGTPERLLELGFPPDVRALSGKGSLYARNLFTYWYLVLWLQATHLDPETSTAYGDVTDPRPAESWISKIASWRSDRSPEIERRIAKFSNSGRIRCKLVDVASQYDHLVPPKLHFDAYRSMVERAGCAALYRGRLVENAQHVDSWSDDPDYPSMVPGYPAVMAAWDELVAWVEG